MAYIERNEIVAALEHAPQLKEYLYRNGFIITKLPTINWHYPKDTPFMPIGDLLKSGVFQSTCTVPKTLMYMQMLV